MIARPRIRSVFGVAGATVAFAVCGPPTLAQFPGGPGGASPFNDALINAPIEALNYSLHLSAGQRARITAIQEEVHRTFARIMTPSGAPGDFSAMQANFEKVRKLDSEGTAKITALLTPAQKKTLPATLKEIAVYNGAGLPLSLMGTLRLTEAEQQRLTAMAASNRKALEAKLHSLQQTGNFAAIGSIFSDNQRQLQASARKVLTPSQAAAVTAYLAAHPQQPGGFGPIGGPPGAGRAAAVPVGIDLYVLVKKLSRFPAEAAFTATQAEPLSDLLEPLFEQPELDPAAARATLDGALALLTPAQVSALATMHDITPASVQPPAASGFGGFPGGPGGPPPGPPPGGPPPAGGPGGPPPGGPPPGGGPGGFPGGAFGMGATRSNPRFNPFYNTPGVAIAEQAGRDLRAVLDSLDRAAAPVTVHPAPIALEPTQKIDVTTFHYDAARTGWNREERVLSPGALDTHRFGRLWHTVLDGQVYASPLVVTGKRLGDNARDLILAPTENNTVYALDAETGEIVWQRHLARALSDTEYNDCINITPLHGITSTPVVDLEHKEVYVCGLTSSRLKQLYMVWALDLATGDVKSGWPITLAGAYQGLTFDGGQLTQRGALTIVDGHLYIPFASRCDIGEWHGWVMGVDTRNPAAAQTAFSPSPDTSGGGIWGSAGLAADAQGQLYAVTGNGDYNLNEGGKSIVESVLRLTTRNGLGFSYQPGDYYVPANHEELDRMDADLGGSSAIVLDHPGSATPHLLFTGGKDGFLYLLDRDNLGGVGAEIQKERLFGTGGGFYSSFIKTTPATFEDGQGTHYLIVTGNDKGHDAQGTVALKLGLDDKKRSHCTPLWSTRRPLYQPGSAVISSNGFEDAIVWVIESNKNDDNGGPAGVLHAYEALTGRELYRSNHKERRDSLGDARKFSAPTVANGRVYCGTDGVVAYGPIVEDRNAK